MLDQFEREPAVEFGPFSSPGAVPTAWAAARHTLQAAHVFWLTTVRPSGQPNVSPLLGVWMAGALYFCTGATERKARNLADNAHCVLTTGCNTLDDGLDIVIEGEAATVSDQAELRSVADTYASKYGARFTSPEGTWFGLGAAIRDGTALVYRVAPVTVFGFGKGSSFSQTCWRFATPGGAQSGHD